MKGKVHMIITLGTIAATMRPLPSVPFTIAAAAGSFLPDCDISFSPAGVIPMWLFWKHRTYTHSVAALIFVTAIAYTINKDIGLGLGFGYLLHLLADYTTPMGLPYIWYPLKIGHKKRRASV